MNLYETILTKHQVRKTYGQKLAFRTWLKHYLKQMGIEMTEDNYRSNGTNVLIGDPTTAEIILTAHYDTQPNALFPIIMSFSNWFSFILSQLYFFIPLIFFMAIANGIALLLFKEGLINIGDGFITLNFIPFQFLLLLFYLQVAYGFPNKHTANDNTSGVVTLLNIITKMNHDDLSKVCFVFFDQEELGLVGASKFKKKYRKSIRNTPLINFDCVANGKHISFIAKQEFRDSRFNKLLIEGATSVKDKYPFHVRFVTAFTHIFTSDQLIFKNSVGVVASHKYPIIGYTLTRLHSRFDTKYDNQNIEYLTDAMIAMIESL